MTAMDLQNVKTILLDIEGTVCPISFVKDVLFPYAVDALPRVLDEKWNEPAFRPYRDDFPEDAKVCPETMEAHVRELTEKDVKVAYLKNLQGYLWQTGYTTGALRAPLFPDVLPSLQAWQSRGLRLAIYSSGSVAAQRLLFRHVATADTTSSASDMLEQQTQSYDATPLLTAYFDTANAGPKTVRDSYVRIAEALGSSLGEVLFLSDVVAEVSAAKDAGMAVRIVDRPGNAPVSTTDAEAYGLVQRLDEVELPSLTGME